MIGNLNQRATILSHALTPDGGGGWSESWSAVATIWARLEPLSGDTVFGPDAVESRVRHRITVRRVVNFVAGQRAVIGARVFHIHAKLDEGPMAVYMTLLCEELP